MVWGGNYCHNGSHANAHLLTTVYCRYEKVKVIRNYRDIKLQLTFKFRVLCPSLCYLGLAEEKRVAEKRTLLITQREKTFSFTL